MSKAVTPVTSSRKVGDGPAHLAAAALEFSPSQASAQWHKTQSSVEELELRLLLEAVWECSGYDFRDYAPESLKRRVQHCMQVEKLTTLSALQACVLHDLDCLGRFLSTLSVNVTEMFRDPMFFASLRQRVLPSLQTLPIVRVWSAGCATGEEVYSLSILFREWGLSERVRIYATDMNEVSLRQARRGIFRQAEMQHYTHNYLAAGGTRAFSEYYTAQYASVLFDPTLQANVIWAQHNLVTDQVFNEFQLILCRNVLIYFNPKLRRRVQQLFYESLAAGGWLGLGDKEGLHGIPQAADYTQVADHQKIYRKRALS